MDEEDDPGDVTVTLGQYLSQSVIRNGVFLLGLAAHVALWFQAPAIWPDQVSYGLTTHGSLGYHHHSPGWNDVALVVMCAVIYPAIGIGMEWKWFGLLPPGRPWFFRWLARVVIVLLLFGSYAALRSKLQ